MRRWHPVEALWRDKELGMQACGRLDRLLIVMICIAGTGPVRGDAAWTGALTQQALRSGFQANLPPHLSVVLGLASKAESVPVRQLASRSGQKVHTYNVVVARPEDVVLFVVDERAQSTIAFLLGSGGKLRKAVSYPTGGDPHELSASEARAGLAQETRYWSAFAAGSGAGPGPSRVPPPNPVKAPKPPAVPTPADAPKPPGGPTSP
jgi:hypothetical protein